MELDELNAFTARKTPWYKRDPLAKREKEDYKRFMSVVGKHIVFYSERSGFYKYFQGAVEWLLANSDACVHYVTSDPNDQVFKLHEANPRLIPYYIGDKRLITLMMKLDCDVAVMTLDDLENFYIKRSYIRKDIAYVYMFHHMTSTHLVCTKEAFDHYDTVLCVNATEGGARTGRGDAGYPSSQSRGMRLRPARSADRGLRVAQGRESCRGRRVASSRRARRSVVAGGLPARPVRGRGRRTLAGTRVQRDRASASRVPPKRFLHARWESLQQRYASWSRDDIYFEQDFSTSDSVYDADVLVTDWSSIACEFSFTTMKPCVFVDTPMKVTNPDWEELGIEPADLAIRNQIGASLAMEELSRLGDVVEDMVARPEAWRNRIEEVRSRMIYHKGRGGEIAGAYLLDRMLAKQGDRAVEASGAFRLDRAGVAGWIDEEVRHAG